MLLVGILVGNLVGILVGNLVGILVGNPLFLAFAQANVEILKETKSLTII